MSGSAVNASMDDILVVEGGSADNASMGDILVVEDGSADNASMGDFATFDGTTGKHLLFILFIYLFIYFAVSASVKFSLYCVNSF